MSGKSRKTRQRRSEGVWAAVLCGGLAACLLAVAFTQVPLTALFASLSKTGTFGFQAGNGAVQQSAAGQIRDDDEIRTGSILIPLRRDDCEHRLFDNYTGQIWLMGTVSCEAALTRNREVKSGPDRVQAISSAFRYAR